MITCAVTSYITYSQILKARCFIMYSVDFTGVPTLGSLGDNQLKISLQDLVNAEHQG